MAVTKTLITATVDERLAQQSRALAKAGTAHSAGT